MNTKYLLIGAGVVVLGLAVFFGLRLDTKMDKTGYHPVITPSEFSSTVNNPYFTLTPGMKFVYEAKKEDGLERIEVTVLPETRMVMGVETRIVRDQVFVDGSLVEDTLDWYAQDTEGNVWYFGEDTAEYEDGVQTSRHGAWEAGVDGALPGIVMKAHPKVGDSYYQEYLAGEAEDRGDVLGVEETVTVPQGKFVGCVKTFDYTALDAKSLEHKYYCKEVGFTALEVDTTDNERVELISVEKGVKTLPPMLTPSVSKPPSTQSSETPSAGAGGAVQGSAGGSGGSAGAPVGESITEAQAKALALQKVPGKVTAIAVEMKSGKSVYVVEVNADVGPETDVIIDMKTGAILGTEI